MQNLDLVQQPTAHSFSCKTSIEYNEFGHVVLSFMGVTTTGADEILRLRLNGEKVTSLAKSCFTYFSRADGYDTCHQLEMRPYSVALMPASVIKKESLRTLQNLGAYSREKFGYGKPVAGLLRPVLEGISPEQMRALNIEYLCPLHDPLKTPEGKANMLLSFLCRKDGRRWVGAYLHNPVARLDSYGALIFQTTPMYYS